MNECFWMPHQVFSAVISLSSDPVCPLPVLVHLTLPLLLPCSLRGALLCNARCIRCIFIPHYFTPSKAFAGHKRCWNQNERFNSLLCHTVSRVVWNSRRVSINSTEILSKHFCGFFCREWKLGLFEHNNVFDGCLFFVKSFFIQKENPKLH